MVPQVRRNPSSSQLAVALSAFVIVGLVAVVLRSGGSGPDALETSAADFRAVTEADYRVVTPENGSQAEVQPLGLPRLVDGSVAQPAALDTAEVTPVADTDAPADGGAESSSTSDAPQAADAPAANNNGGNNNTGTNNNTGGNNNNNQEKKEEYDDPTKVKGYDVHAFNEHVVDALGTQMLAPKQGVAGGYEVIGPYEIQARSTITAVRPVIEQGIDDVLERSPNARGVELERKVAQRLTELNDWKNLNNATKEKMMILSGVDIQNLNGRVREDVVNHLLHSPLPFGDIEGVLNPDVKINLGYTHTLDKDWTQVAHLGDGVFQAWIISNNNNGSHTGHIMGSFKVQLTATTSLRDARQVANEMVENKNKNNKLYLDEAARKILYGETPLLDFSNMTGEERRATYAGKGLGTYAGTTGPVPGAAPEPEPVPETTTTETAPESTTTPDSQPEVTTPESTTTEPESTTTQPEVTTTETQPESTTTEPDPANQPAGQDGSG